MDSSGQQPGTMGEGYTAESGPLGVSTMPGQGAGRLWFEPMTPDVKNLIQMESYCT